MKNFIKPLVIFLFSLFLTSCIQIDTKVNVNKDGSGTVEETVLMSDEMVQMLNDFISGFSTDDSVKAEEFKLYNEEDLNKRVSDYGEGVTLISSTEYTTEGRQGYKVVYGFSDINKLKIDQSPESRIPEDESSAVTTEKSYVTFNFNKGDVSELNINMPEPKNDEEESENEEFENQEDSTENGDISEMKFLLKDLSFSLSLHMNGEITETNADYKDGSDITLFKLSFGELMDNAEKLKELKNIKQNDLQELKEIMQGIPGIKIETNDPVSIKFR